MNIINCNLEGLKKYEIEIFKADVCTHLCHLRETEEGAFFDCSGLTNLKAFLSISRRESVTDEIRRLLLCFRKIVEAEIAVSKFLVRDNSLSLNPSEVWMDENKNVVFQPGYCEDDFFTRLINLAEEYNAKELIKRLKEKNALSVMSERDILSFLSLWELELR